MLQRLVAVLVVALCLASVQGYRVLPSTAIHAASTAPRFCNGLKCPEFKTVKLYDTYAEREYKNSTWAYTKISSLVMEPAQLRGFKRLFKYITGANAEEQKLPMGVPAITRITPGDGIFSTSNFTIGFYIPHNDPPAPAVDQVYVKEFGSKSVYVRQFGGFAISPVVGCMAKDFVAQLKADGRPIVEGAFIVAIYNAPFQLLHRHNEIWVLKDDGDTEDF